MRIQRFYFQRNRMETDNGILQLVAMVEIAAFGNTVTSQYYIVYKNKLMYTN